MSNFGYRKELGKYEDIDEDELLASLTSEELQELEKAMAEIEADENIPIGQRQQDQTTKQPTGHFNREALLKYWEDETQGLLEHCMDESQADMSEAECGSEELDDNEKEGEQQNGRCKKGGNREMEVSSKKQNFTGYRSRKTNGISKSILYHVDSNLTVTPERPSGNSVDINQTLEKILSNDASVRTINLNNIENISQGILMSFADALTSNTQVEVFSLANTHAEDQVAFALAKMLMTNQSITNLNVESNFISGKGILALIGSLQNNTTLVELRFHNQRHICGGQVEMEMVRLLRENTTLLKLGYQFDLPGPRMTATGILTRNQDRQRQRRLEQRKEIANKEHTKTLDIVDKTLTAKFQISTNKKAQQKQHNLVSTLPQQLTSQPNDTKNVPTRKIAETVKKHEETAMDNNLGQNKTNANNGHKLTGDKHVPKHDENSNKGLKYALKPAALRQKDDKKCLEGNQVSMRDNLLAAIRGSSVGTLRRVNVTPHRS